LPFEAMKKPGLARLLFLPGRRRLEGRAGTITDAREFGIVGG
jgi:hypothetical protein